MKLALIELFLLLCCTATAAAATIADDTATTIGILGEGNPAVVSYRIAPTVVRSDRTTPVTLAVKITGGTPDRAVLTFQDTTELALHDDGINGDATAGDGIYSALVPIARVTGGLQASDVFRKFVGFADVYVGTTRQQRINVFAQVWTPEIGTVSVVSPDFQTQYSNYVLNVVDTATFNAGPSADMRPAVRRLYQRFGDAFDFVDVVFDTATIANRFHFAVKNEVRGIGLNPLDNSSQYGSAGRLLGVSVFPIHSFFDGADGGHSHELGHQWINFLPLPVLAAGTPHWPVSSLASGTMGLSIPGSGAGGDYNCTLTPVAAGLQMGQAPAPRVFKDLDLYLMGLLPSSQVATHYVFANQSTAASVPCTGTLPYGMFNAITINDVIALAGARNPPYPAKTDFTVAVIVVSDALLSPEGMALYDWFARRAEARDAVQAHVGLVTVPSAPFYLQTGTRATLASRIANLPLTIVEYYNAALDHYFITWLANEMNDLDTGVHKGWVRTGEQFRTLTAAQTGTSPVCRFYIPPALGDSHFFGRGTVECNATGQKNPSFTLEDASFMQMYLPVAGVCPPGAVPIYRVFSNRADANHRYMISKALRDQMVAKGWLAEGDGPDLVVMCAPA